MKTARTSDQMLNYGMYQMTDDTGVPSHYLLDTVSRGKSSEQDFSVESSFRRDMADPDSIYAT